MKEKGVREKRIEVTFKLQDVLCPEPEVIMAHLESRVEVIGRVQFYSDGGTQEDQFAIVEVPGISVPVVVPRSRLRVLSAVESEQEVRKTLLQRLDRGSAL